MEQLKRDNLLLRQKLDAVVALCGDCLRCSSRITDLTQGQADISNQDTLLLERNRLLEAERVALQMENENQRFQYEGCLDEIASRIVEAIVSQRNLKEECSRLQRRVVDLEGQNQEMLLNFRQKFQGLQFSSAPALQSATIFDPRISLSMPSDAGQSALHYNQGRPHSGLQECRSPPSPTERDVVVRNTLHGLSDSLDEHIRQVLRLTKELTHLADGRDDDAKDAEKVPSLNNDARHLGNVYQHPESGGRDDVDSSLRVQGLLSGANTSNSDDEGDSWSQEDDCCDCCSTSLSELLDEPESSGEQMHAGRASSPYSAEEHRVDCAARNTNTDATFRPFKLDKDSVMGRGIAQTMENGIRATPTVSASLNANLDLYRTLPSNSRCRQNTLSSSYRLPVSEPDLRLNPNSALSPETPSVERFPGFGGILENVSHQDRIVPYRNAKLRNYDCFQSNCGTSLSNCETTGNQGQFNCALRDDSRISSPPRLSTNHKTNKDINNILAQTCGKKELCDRDGRLNCERLSALFGYQCSGSHAQLQRESWPLRSYSCRHRPRNSDCLCENNTRHFQTRIHEIGTLGTQSCCLRYSANYPPGNGRDGGNGKPVRPHSDSCLGYTVSTRPDSGHRYEVNARPCDLFSGKAYSCAQLPKTSTSSISSSFGLRPDGKIERRPYHSFGEVDFNPLTTMDDYHASGSGGGLRSEHSRGSFHFDRRSSLVGDNRSVRLEGISPLYSRSLNMDIFTAEPVTNRQFVTRSNESLTSYSAQRVTIVKTQHDALIGKGQAQTENQQDLPVEFIAQTPFQSSLSPDISASSRSETAQNRGCYSDKHLAKRKINEFPVGNDKGLHTNEGEIPDTNSWTVPGFGKTLKQAAMPCTANGSADCDSGVEMGKRMSSVSLYLGGGVEKNGSESGIAAGEAGAMNKGLFPLNYTQVQEECMLFEPVLELQNNLVLPNFRQQADLPKALDEEPVEDDSKESIAFHRSWSCCDMSSSDDSSNSGTDEETRSLGDKFARNFRFRSRQHPSRSLPHSQPVMGSKRLLSHSQQSPNSQSSRWFDPTKSRLFRNCSDASSDENDEKCQSAYRSKATEKNSATRHNMASNFQSSGKSRSDSSWFGSGSSREAGGLFVLEPLQHRSVLALKHEIQHEKCYYHDHRLLLNGVKGHSLGGRETGQLGMRPRPRPTADSGSCWSLSDSCFETFSASNPRINDSTIL